eukprot:3032927-Rhodomonas_salina.1
MCIRDRSPTAQVYWSERLVVEQSAGVLVGALGSRAVRSSSETAEGVSTPMSVSSSYPHHTLSQYRTSHSTHIAPYAISVPDIPCSIRDLSTRYSIHHALCR